MILLGSHDALLLLVFGMAIDAMFGDMPAVFAHIPHPVVLAGRAIGFFDRKLNRASRCHSSVRIPHWWMTSTR